MAQLSASSVLSIDTSRCRPVAVAATRSSSVYWPAAVTFTVYLSHSPAATIPTFVPGSFVGGPEGCRSTLTSVR